MNKIGIFTWEKGSINDNIRKILIEKNIAYRNTLHGVIEVDLLGIGLWQRVETAPIDPRAEKTYVVYVE